MDATAEFLANKKGVGINTDNWDEISISTLSARNLIFNRESYGKRYLSKKCK